VKSLKKLGYVALTFAGISIIFLSFVFVGNWVIDYAERWSCTLPTASYFFFKRHLASLMYVSIIFAFLGLATLPWLSIEQRVQHQ